jgi:hypothetical protein
MVFILHIFLYSSMIVGVVANVPPANSEPMETLPVSGVLVQGLPPSVLVNQAPPQSRINSQAPPPSGIPAPAVAVIPPPGIICNVSTIILLKMFEPRQDKTNVMCLRPAWIQTSLRVCTV